MRGRRWGWLAAALLLFGGAALLMSFASAPKAPPPRVNMPRHMDAEGLQRAMRRRTLPAPELPTAEASQNDERPRLTDPVLRAMPAEVKKAAIVLEANAIRYSPVGKLLIACFMGSGMKVDDLKQKMGIDPLTDLDRISAFDNTFVFSGQFGGAKWQQMFEHTTPIALNDHTQLFERPSGGEVVATWKDTMVIAGHSRGEVEAVVARLEGTAPAPEHPLLDENDSYGEAYGVVAPDAVAELLAREQPALAERLRQVVSGISLHVDASHDVGIVLDASGAGQDTADFGKAVGSALAVARLAATTQGNKDLSEVLDYARVVPDGDGKSFRTELALPLAFFEEKLRDCAGKGQGAGEP